MVISKKFVWAHMGKTGGDSTRKMFGLLSHAYNIADDVTLPIKHHTFRQRMAVTGVDLSEKMKILNIRRLPTWVLSHCQHQKKFEGRDFTRDHLLDGVAVFPRSNRKADELLRAYVSDYKTDHWLRMEYLAKDFIRVIGQYMAISKTQKAAIRAVRENINNTYSKDIKDWFSPEEMNHLYNNNLFWKEIERQIYGNTMVEEIW